MKRRSGDPTILLCMSAASAAPAIPIVQALRTSQSKPARLPFINGLALNAAVINGS